MPTPTPHATDWITIAGMIAATLGSALACGVAVKRLTRAGGWERLVEQAATVAVTLACGGVFVYREVAVHGNLQPLQSHIDGLSLLSALLGCVILYVQWTRRLRGIETFALPVLLMLTLWGVCASWWSYQPFNIGGLWMAVHLLSVYIGTAALATAAAAGGLYLFLDKQLRSKDDRAQRLKVLGRLGDLETVEATITVSAKVGFLLLTIGLFTGFVILASTDNRLSEGWWYSPKVVLAAVVWVIFALVMHVRFVPNFRGRRAALLAIVGFVLMIGVLGIAQTLPSVSVGGEGEEPRRGAPWSELSVAPGVEDGG